MGAEAPFFFGHHHLTGLAGVIGGAGLVMKPSVCLARERCATAPNVYVRYPYDG